MPTLAANGGYLRTNYRQANSFLVGAMDKDNLSLSLGFPGSAYVSPGLVFFSASLLFIFGTKATAVVFSIFDSMSASVFGLAL